MSAFAKKIVSVFLMVQTLDMMATILVLKDYFIDLSNSIY